LDHHSIPYLIKRIFGENQRKNKDNCAIFMGEGEVLYFATLASGSSGNAVLVGGQKAVF
jgi:hypothetical protein